LASVVHEAALAKVLYISPRSQARVIAETWLRHSLDCGVGRSEARVLEHVSEYDSRFSFAKPGKDDCREYRVRNAALLSIAGLWTVGVAVGVAAVLVTNPNNLRGRLPLFSVGRGGRCSAPLGWVPLRCSQSRLRRRRCRGLQVQYKRRNRRLSWQRQGRRQLQRRQRRRRPCQQARRCRQRQPACWSPLVLQPACRRPRRLARHSLSVTSGSKPTRISDTVVPLRLSRQPSGSTVTLVGKQLARRQGGVEGLGAPSAVVLPDGNPELRFNGVKIAIRGADVDVDSPRDLARREAVRPMLIQQGGHPRQPRARSRLANPSPAWAISSITVPTIGCKIRPLELRGHGRSTLRSTRPRRLLSGTGPSTVGVRRRPDDAS
jgi:hypothetical protein